ncbi:glycoside hydrolase family 30 beta sandwich domain-containing protein [Paenibacillus sp. NPDC056722]|uniref:glycoside hydrolase family 30 beta sandwich domain-containing protein n=1 Tax=Paenibacillus sp. NPDC056722 TaxID=3345924 RepID=UPI0036B829AA
MIQHSRKRRQKQARPRPLSKLMLAATVLFTSFAIPFHPPSAQAAPGAAQVYFSSESTTGSPGSSIWYNNPAAASAGIQYATSKQADIPLTNPTNSTATAITVNPEVQYQNMLGFGTSLEESTIYNLSLMSAAKRDEVLRRLIDPVNGAGMNLFRITFGTSDFTSRNFYTYEDTRGSFSIQKDIDYNIVSTVQRAIAIGNETGNPVKIFASSWTAPAWMKTNNSLIGGYLKRENTNDLAVYYRRAIQEYQSRGIPIYAMTLQNEPLYAAPDYPSMLLTSANERELAIALKSQLDTYSISTKLWAYDHNFGEVWTHLPGVLDNAAANAAIEGVAFHDYSGDPTAMTAVRNTYPSKSMQMTERAVWGTGGADRMAQYFRNWSGSYTNWVTMLDQNIQPEKWTGTPGPTMLIQSTSNRNTYWVAPEVNFIGQYAKFVKPGAKRIDSNYGSAATVTNVAFLNPDNSIVTVVINQTSSAKSFKILSEGQQLLGTLPAKTVGTYIWTRGGGGGTGSVPIGSTIALQSMANNLYVSADNAGASPLIANRTTVGTWERFQVADAGGGWISLRALANNKYVTAENGGADSLIASRDTVQGWEQFQWIDNGDGTISLLSNANNRYVTADNFGNSALIANRTSIDGWEKFKFSIQ